ncbi:MAG: tRNA (adenosine(37)-N6)-threonylcarbamoyltransferase complex ATPase subunit type 1 TsaE, partial [Rhodomicrobium sp.]|nr:tRNA (adenosine(37)-N6)-threonylcarbamoyltransferase complex ATPase subunit type 1 TsaE [Rhodomicrobium sp.]
MMELSRIDERALQRVAESLAPRLRIGDMIALRGDLGAGKTAFARHLIRTLTGRADEDVPSPTFALVQPYESPRFPIHHFDFYRLNGPDQAAELGVEEALESGIVIAEWPERLESLLPSDRLDITLSEDTEPHLRGLTLEGQGKWSPRLARFSAILTF